MPAATAPASVWVIGSDPALRSEVGAALESAGLQVGCFAEAPRRAVPSLLVVTGRDPAALAARVRSQAWLAGVPLLALLPPGETGATAALAAGSDDVMRTPLDPVVLAHRVHALLEAERGRVQLAETRTRLDDLERVARIARFETDAEVAEFAVTAAWRALVGIPGAGPVTRAQLLERLASQDRAAFAHALEKAAEGDHGFTIDARVVSDGEPPRILHWRAEARAGEHSGLVGTAQDLTERRHAERQARFLSEHDGLTGLPNRAAFLRLMDAALRECGENRRMALLLVDVDNFKRVNETLGHRAGDHILQGVARRLEGALAEREGSPAGMLARLGADELGVLLDGVHDIETMARLARRMLAALREPFAIEGTDLIVSASIGIAVAPSDGEDVDTLLRSAHAAMYRAKEKGRNNFRFFTESIVDPGSRRYVLERKLCRAFENHELEVYYQPQLEMESGRISGAEALLRWTDPEYGAVSPAEFVPLAEEAGLIVPIGEWVLRTACWQGKAWQEAGVDVRVAVNISPHHFECESFASLVSQTLWDTGLQPARLELEITENVLMQDQERVVGILRELKDLGVSISLDDFGTGYSSLSYLKLFPVDAVKIDRSFVRDIGVDVDDAAITDAILSMARALRLRVVAEGVETERQREFLRSRGCDEMQGYLFSPPVEADAVNALLEIERVEASGSGEPPEGSEPT